MGVFKWIHDFLIPTNIIGINRDMFIDMSYGTYIPQFHPLRGARRSVTPAAMSLVSKYHSLIKGTGAPCKTGLCQGWGRENTG